MSTQEKLAEARRALSAFLVNECKLDEVQMRAASKFVAAYVAAAVNDHPRRVAEQQAADERRAKAEADAIAHFKRQQSRLTIEEAMMGFVRWRGGAGMH